MRYTCKSGLFETRRFALLIPLLIKVVDKNWSSSSYQKKKKMQFVFGKKNIPSIPELGNLPNIAATYESTKEDRSKTKQT